MKINNQEEWRPVVGYEGRYEVSNFGRVKSLDYNHTGKEGIMKPKSNDRGYLYISLCKNRKKKSYQVHQLIMRAFVGECPEGHQVDHIDWNPRNNRLENLRYIPAKENASRHSPEWFVKIQKVLQDPEWRKNVAEANKRHSQNPEWLQNVAEANKRKSQDPEWQKKNVEGAKKRTKPIDQYTIDGEYVKTWESAKDAAKELEIQASSISSCCKGKRHTAGGFIWRFA